MSETRWYHFIAYYFGGMFLINTVPHLVAGISGSPFQTPFASPPGVGESLPVMNVLWGFVNFVAGALLLHYFQPHGALAWLGWSLFGMGALLLGMQMAAHFSKVRAGNR